MTRRSAATLVVSIATILPPTVAQGQACDLTKCECDGVNLSALKGKLFKAPADAEGYAYSLSICGEIPKASLPSGCQQYAEHPSVIKVSVLAHLCLHAPLAVVAAYHKREHAGGAGTTESAKALGTDVDRSASATWT